ncbi:MAG TPA: peptidoglycan-binding domain-containing protein [Stenomitos sp.]
MDIRNQSNRAVTRPLTTPGTRPLSAPQPTEAPKKRGLLGHLADVFIGGGEAIKDMGVGLYTMVRHPIQTAKGVGFLVTKLVTDPKEGLSMLGHAFVDPYTKAIREGRPGLAIGRGIVEIGSMFVSPSEVAGAAKATAVGTTSAYAALKAGQGVSEAVKSASLAVKLSTQAADLADKAAKLSKLGYVAEAGKVEQMATLTGKIAGYARAGDAARAASRMAMLSGLQNINVAGQMMSTAALLAHTDDLLAAGTRAAAAAAGAGRVEEGLTKASGADEAIRASTLVEGAGTVAARGVVESLPAFDRMMQLAGRVATVSPFVLLSPASALTMGLLKQGLPTQEETANLDESKLQALAVKYNLAPDAGNVRQFLSEVGRYDRDAIGPGQGEPAQIKQIQAALRVAGYDVQPTGTFDDATALAVLHFKQAKGLHQDYKQADGSFAINEYVDSQTANALYDVVQSVDRKPEPTMSAEAVKTYAADHNLYPSEENVLAFQKEIAAYGQAVGPDSASADVSRLQSLLGRLGYKVTLTGTFDDATAEAVMAFKNKAGIRQGYKLANGDWAINEYVDPTTELRMRAALQSAAGKTL